MCFVSCPFVGSPPRPPQGADHRESTHVAAILPWRLRISHERVPKPHKAVGSKRRITMHQTFTFESGAAGPASRHDRKALGARSDDAAPTGHTRSADHGRGP